MSRVCYAAFGGLAVQVLVIAFLLLRLDLFGRDRDAWRDTAGDYLRAAHAWERSYRDDAELRQQETQGARTSADAAAKACDARVAAARRSAAAIQTIIKKEPARDPNGCPVRELVAPDLLRDALAAPTAR